MNEIAGYISAYLGIFLAAALATMTVVTAIAVTERRKTK